MNFIIKNFMLFFMFLFIKHTSNKQRVYTPYSFFVFFFFLFQNRQALRSSRNNFAGILFVIFFKIFRFLNNFYCFLPNKFVKLFNRNFNIIFTNRLCCVFRIRFLSIKTIIFYLFFGFDYS